MIEKSEIGRNPDGRFNASGYACMRMLRCTVCVVVVQHRSMESQGGCIILILRVCSSCTYTTCMCVACMNMRMRMYIIGQIYAIVSEWPLRSTGLTIKSRNKCRWSITHASSFKPDPETGRGALLILLIWFGPVFA